jgi:hypothetical protein
MQREWLPVLSGVTRMLNVTKMELESKFRYPYTYVHIYIPCVCIGVTDHEIMYYHEILCLVCVRQTLLIFMPIAETIPSTPELRIPFRNTANVINGRQDTRHHGYDQHRSNTSGTALIKSSNAMVLRKYCMRTPTCDMHTYIPNTKYSRHTISFEWSVLRGSTCPPLMPSSIDFFGKNCRQKTSDTVLRWQRHTSFSAEIYVHWRFCSLAASRWSKCIKTTSQRLRQ